MRNKDLSGTYPFTVREIKTYQNNYNPNITMLEVRLRVHTNANEHADIYERIGLSTDKKYWWKTGPFLQSIRAPQFTPATAKEALEGLTGTARFGSNKNGTGAEVKEFKI